MTADQLPLHIVIIAVFRQAENAVGLIDSNIIPDSQTHADDVAPERFIAVSVNHFPVTGQDHVRLHRVHNIHEPLEILRIPSMAHRMENIHAERPCERIKLIIAFRHDMVACLRIQDQSREG